MLRALWRRKNEGIVINDEIVVTVGELREDGARLHIMLPRDGLVARLEAYKAMHGCEPPAHRQKASAGEMPSLEALDRLARKLTGESKHYVSREMVFEAILESIAALEEQVSEATSLEHLKQLLLRRRY